MKFRVVSSDYVIVDDKVWFVPMDYLYLCCYDPTSQKNETQIRLPKPGNFNYNKGYFEHLVCVDRKIIGIPYWTDYFFVYDIDKNEMKIARFSNYNDDYCGFGFYATCVYEKNIVSFIRSLHLDPLSGIHIAKYCIEENTAVLEDIGLNKAFDNSNSFDIAFRRETVQTETSLYLILSPIGQIVEYSKDDMVIVHNIESKGCDYTTIAQVDGKSFCLSTNGGELVIWNKDQGIIKKRRININGFRHLEDYNTNSFSELFGFSVVFCNKVYLFPYLANKVIQYDYIEDKIEEAFFSSSVCCAEEERPTDDSNYGCGQFAQPHLCESKLYLWNIWSGLFFTVDLLSKEIKRDDMYIVFEDDEYKNDFREFLKQENPILERKGNALLSLDGFLLGVMEGDV